MDNQNDHDTYIIPSNFVDTGTFFGGMFKARNVIEAGILAAVIGIPVFVLLPFGLTAKIIVLCLTALPLALFALIGISGESLSSFLVIFIRYVKNRRVVGGDGQPQAETAVEKDKTVKKLQKIKSEIMVVQAEKTSAVKKNKTRRRDREDFPAEFDEVKGYELRQKLRPVRKPIKSGTAEKTAHSGAMGRAAGNTEKKSQGSAAEKRRRERPSLPVREQKPSCLNPVADYLPITKIENGIIYTRDRRYVKVVEVVPINFLLRSAREQRSIIYSFVSYLKISPVRLQFKVLTRKADIGRHLDTVQREMAQETNEQCRLMQEDYLQFVRQIGSREAVTRRFFLIFEYEPCGSARRSDEEGEAVASLQGAVHTAVNYLRQCGNEILIPENEDAFTVDMLYNLLCRNESAGKPLPERVREVVGKYQAEGRQGDMDNIPAGEFFSPGSIDFTHGRYSASTAFIMLTCWFLQMVTGHKCLPDGSV